MSHARDPPYQYRHTLVEYMGSDPRGFARHAFSDSDQGREIRQLLKDALVEGIQDQIDRFVQAAYTDLNKPALTAKDISNHISDMADIRMSHQKLLSWVRSYEERTERQLLIEVEGSKPKQYKLALPQKITYRR